MLKNFDKAGKRNHLVGNCDTGIIIALDISPNTNGVRYSVYSDTASFMEIEAVGGCPATIMTDAEIKVQVATQYLIE